MIRDNRTPGIIIYHLRSTARRTVDKLIISSLSLAGTLGTAAPLCRLGFLSIGNNYVVAWSMVGQPARSGTIDCAHEIIFRADELYCCRSHPSPSRRLVQNSRCIIADTLPGT